jgi:hypothetical protein
MESERVAVDPARLARWYDDLAVAVRDVPRAFVFNVDETGCCDFVDSRELTVVVPFNFEGDTIPLPVDRHSKQSTFAVCIAADGSARRPFVILDRVTMEKDIHYVGYGRSHTHVVSQENAFMTSKLFELWSMVFFFPGVAELRRTFGYDGKAFLILDGLTCHHTSTFEAECEARNIELVFLVPHSSDQTQPLDVITLSALKGHFARARVARVNTPQSRKIVRMLGSFHAATAPDQVVEAFMSMGLIPEERGGEMYLTVNMPGPRRVRPHPFFS